MIEGLVIIDEMMPPTLPVDIYFANFSYHFVILNLLNSTHDNCYEVCALYNGI